MIIKVKANAEKKAMPDYMRVTVTLTNLSDSKETSMKKVLDNYHIVEDFFRNNGVSEDFQSASYSISEEYENQKYEVISQGEKVIKTRKIFKGYVAKQILVLDIPINVALIISAMDELTKKDEIYINASYYLKDKKAFQDEIIREALKRAKEKAFVISKVNSSEEPKLTVVDYTYNEYNSTSNYRGSIMEASVCKNSRMVDDIAKTIKPQEITLSESVYTEWEA